MRLANIGAREIRKRRALGIVSAVAAGLLGFVLIGYGAPIIPPNTKFEDRFGQVDFRLASVSVGDVFSMEREP